MRRLLIVDDEAIITDGLAEIIGGLNWPGLEIYKAYSGGEALEWLNRTRIDVVLSDIRMPELSGLELMEVIRREWPRCRIIFLTGYNDFHAVYQAIQAWGVRYLLKTEGYGKVIAQVEETLRELDEGLRIDTLLQQAKEQRNTLETLAQGEYFRHVLLGKGRAAAAEREDDFRKLNVPLDPALPVLLVLGSLLHAADGRSYAGRQEAALAAKLLGDSYYKDRTQSVGIVDRYGDLLWFIQPSGFAADAGEAFESATRFLEGTLELIQEGCRDSLGLETTFTVYGTPCTWEALPSAYERIRQMQHQLAGDGARLVMTIRAESLENTAGQLREGLRADKLEPLAGLLESGRRDEFMDTLNELTEAVLGEAVGEAVQVQVLELYYSIALVLLGYVNRRQLGDLVPAAELMRFEEHASWQEALQYLGRTADRLFSLRRTSENNRAEAVIEGICAYIEDNLAEDLSNVRLASRFHFNPAYLSRLFKQGRGVNLSDYIEEARIRRAKLLLAAEELRIHAVGAKVGYESPHSFTRFFKKATGMTPQEYRDSIRQPAASSSIRENAK